MSFLTPISGGVSPEARRALIDGAIETSVGRERLAKIIRDMHTRLTEPQAEDLSDEYYLARSIPRFREFIEIIQRIQAHGFDMTENLYQDVYPSKKISLRDILTLLETRLDTLINDPSIMADLDVVQVMDA